MTTAQRKFKSDAFEAIHSAAAGMHSDKIISKTTMREYDALCVIEAPSLNAEEIKTIRTANHLSQPVFAGYLNVSRSTVEKWESGNKHPTGAALKLLSIVNRHGLKILA